MTASVDAGAARAGDPGSELARMLASFFWVFGATLASLALLGWLPVWLGGGKGAVHVASVQEAERRLGARVLVPGYFPERLSWPPVEVRVAGGRRGSVLLAFGCRDGGPPVVLLQAIEPGTPVAPELLEGRTVLQASPAVVGGRPATLSDVLAGGQRERELAWELQGRAMVLRSAGDVAELFRMAKSAHREGGR
jgi:hypothetical protein